MAKRKMADWPGVADEVLYVPSEVLEGPAAAIRNPKKKTAKKKTAKKKAARKKVAKRTREYVTDIAALEPFGKDADMLVRTALLRPKDYNPNRKTMLHVPAQAAHLCKHMIDYDDEHYVVLVVDHRNALRAIYEAAKGGPAHAAVHLHSVLKVPLLVGGAAIISVHNHPSGMPDPSPDDVAMHKKLRESLDCIGMSLLDWIIPSC